MPETHTNPYARPEPHVSDFNRPVVEEFRANGLVAYRRRDMVFG